MNDNQNSRYLVFWLSTAAFFALAAWLLSGCTADGSFDGAAFREAVGAGTDVYRTYEDERRLNANPYAPQPGPTP